MEFKEFALDKRLLEGIDAIGFKEATPVQVQVIPLILQGDDVIASAQTGTGKTAAFLLPVIHKITSQKQDGQVKALIIVPTRELAVQIDHQMEGFSYFTPVSSIAVYGGTDGTSFAQEKKALSKGAEVIIGTPGRLIAHLNMGYVNISGLRYLILDEADRMLDMGFFDDIMKILSYLPDKRQTLMFSATMPHKIRQLAKKVLHTPKEISISMSKPAEKILQLAYVVYQKQKIPLVSYLLQSKQLRSVLIFCSTKLSAKELNKTLRKKGLKVADIHSDLSQDKREEALRAFKARRINILVATDILSRGIDIEDIDLVINFDVPNDGEDYIHRIGRTARAEADGVAITLIDEKSQGKFAEIEELLGEAVYKSQVPKELGESPDYNPLKRRPYQKRRPSGRKFKNKGQKHHDRPGKKK